MRLYEYTTVTMGTGTVPLVSVDIILSNINLRDSQEIIVGEHLGNIVLCAIPHILTKNQHSVVIVASR